MTGWPILNFVLSLLICWSVHSIPWCHSLRYVAWHFYNPWISSKIIFPLCVPWYLLLLSRWVRHPSAWSHSHIRKNGDSVPLLPGNILWQQHVNGRSSSLSRSLLSKNLVSVCFRKLWTFSTFALPCGWNGLDYNLLIPTWSHNSFSTVF